MVRLSGEHHAQDGGAEALLGGLEGTGALGGEGEQGDGRVDGVPLGGAEGGAGADGEGAPDAAAGAERLEFDAVVGAADDGAGGGGAFAQPLDVGGEAGGPAGGPLGRDGDGLAGGVVEGGPAVDVRGEAGDDGVGALGERGPGQFALDLEAGGDGAVLVGGDGGGDGLADGEEGGAARHFEERQVLLAGRFEERRGDLVVVHPHGEPEPDDPGGEQPPHVAAHRLQVLGVEGERGGEQQLAALHVGHGIGELTDVRPADGGVETVLPGTDDELEGGVLRERGEGGRHWGPSDLWGEGGAPPVGRRAPDCASPREG